MKPERLHGSIAFLFLAFATSGVAGQVTRQQVDAALGMLPEALRPGATVLVVAESGPVVRRQGDNGWTCRVTRLPERLAATCHQDVLTTKIDLERRLNAEGMSGAQVRERMAELIESGGLSVPPGSVEISGSGPLKYGSEVPETMSGYYFVYFPFATVETIGVGDSDPGDGGAWLHHAGTSDAHLMWERSHRAGGDADDRSRPEAQPKVVPR